MGWRYKAGLTLVAAVVVIWVTSAEITQDIFNDYKQPFAVTYLGASLMYIEEAQKLFEMEARVPMSKKNSEIDLSVHEEAMLLIAESGDGFVKSIRHETEITAKQIAAYGFCIAPLWFLTEYMSNAALARTSVASTTVLSSTSGLFTLFIGAFLGQDSLNVAKIVAVSVSIAGVVMTTFGKTWAADEPKLNSSASSERSLVGDIFGLLSAVTYALFTVLLKKFSGEEGEKIDVQKLFGYIGLFTLVGLWWLAHYVLYGPHLWWPL